MKCPACGALGKQIATQVFQCERCEAVYGTVYRGELHRYVIMQFFPGNVPPERERYFDFTVLGAHRIARVHGWYDIETKRVTQVG